MNTIKINEFVNFTKIIDIECDGNPKVLTLISPKLELTNAPANTIQMSIEQDGQDAYIDLDLSESILLRDKISEWIKDKEDHNNRTK
ncbi:hypothetical protein G6N05_05300 [Flavobacterium sp. F372]|uniref:DUF3006 domain-containing protein n=1 Tax=Flavobacterium bernardetii TaxID=2813823 RepID=A0ABR7J179_9FLAO|nr:hypothetical protein [Flavobacterium bernardetii]MBC5835796.1 hypothetical protein [Flavobacterium bernardetii]NHF69527.1 hypothetical protein [Flavobacterium bernardetii]